MSTTKIDYVSLWELTNPVRQLLFRYTFNEHFQTYNVYRKAKLDKREVNNLFLTLVSFLCVFFSVTSVSVGYTHVNRHIYQSFYFYMHRGLRQWFEILTCLVYALNSNSKERLQGTL